MKNWIVVVVLCLASKVSIGDSESRHFSGMIESYYRSLAIGEALQSRQDPERIMADFIEREFGQVFSLSRGDFRWEKNNVIQDATHIHAGFGLKYKERSVVDRGLKINVRQSGEIDSAINNFATPFVLQLPDPAVTEERERALKRQLWTEWENRLGAIKGDIKIEPVIWIDPQSNVGYPAFDVRIILDSPWALRRYIIHEETGNILEEKQTTRSVSSAARVYKVSPFSSGTSDSVTLTDLNSASALRNDYIWVRRERSSRATTETIEVTPGNYTDQGGGACSSFKSNPTPSEYSSCSDSLATTTTCCNIAFDAVNAYYHVSNFRTRINGYVTQLGATVNWTYDAPVNSNTGATNTFSVLINPVSLDFGDPGLSDDANNALYVGEPCRSDGSMDRCLVFLRPASLSASASSATCNRSSSTLFDLAREGIVVAHEYQHYVTDMITRIAFSSTGSPKVGDAIHEGYSDYMAASYVSSLAARDVTLVGEFALQQCTPLQRDISTLRVYNDSDTSNNDDIHLPGQSWASAFWKLRTEYGAEIADLLSLKSQFFLSTTPGFIESIEAVVQADQAIYAGAHVERIRRLFYSEITFTGKNALPASGVGEIGFKGCSAVHSAKRPRPTTLFVLLCYFATVLTIGRTVYMRRKNG